MALLLNASAKSAFAQISPYQASHNHILDDFTFGNTEEDIDATGLAATSIPITGRQTRTTTSDLQRLINS